MALARTQPERAVRGPAWQLQFLQHEAGATANFFDFVKQARLELDHFIRFGDLTASDKSFYRALQKEVADFAASIDASGKAWIESNIPDAFDIGATTHAPNLVIPRDALDALSKDSLGLIRNVTDEIRRDIRHTIAAGILGGLSGPELRARITASGIGRGRWPSVEYRAGVIARTETLRAYNGGALHGMRGNGARFARWIVSPDEATCSICAPRAGKVYRLQSFMADTSAYPGAERLPKLPAHPRCRCTIAAVYRDADGKVIGDHVAPVEPKSPPAIVDEPAVTPPAVGDFQGAVDDLVNYAGRRLAGEDVSADHAFWRTLDLADPDRLSILSNLPDSRFDDFLTARYGTRFDPQGPFDPALKRSIVEGLERFRGVRQEWVTDSTYLDRIGAHSMRRPDLDPGVLGVCYADGRVSFDFTALTRGGSYGPGKKLRISPDNPIDEVAIHEFAHALHNRFGAHAHLGYPATEFGGRKIGFAELQRMTTDEKVAWTNELLASESAAEAWKAGWAKARRASTGIAPASTNASAQIQMYTREVEQAREMIAEIDRQIAAGKQLFHIETVRETYVKRLAGAERMLDTYLGLAKKPVEHYPTEYAKSSEFEDFAESVTMYMLDPKRLARWSPKRYAFLRDSVFGGVEFS